MKFSNKNKQKSNSWDDDHYTLLARKENYPARSVYKLKEIQQKVNLIKKGHKVLDLGCAPGSWLMYAAEQVGNAGRVAGIDLKPVEIPLPSNATALVGDVFEFDFGPFNPPFDLVTSDMAPATTGRKDVDAARSYDLSLAALDVALKLLKPGGSFVCKIFQGSGFDSFVATVKTKFKTQKIFKPQSCRKESKEIYIIGIGKNEEE
ncbi:RlmE family RNA methyltransferase [Desulforegula conservatrix]|uniref:RlmE family RNA methyltransferase n=1 Tax=Desulforegula conservatrix TaxID=153026 RepID=UPI0003F7549E|nr:RlmE family RNA methyltransferase [Desulforegula conservatrix]